MLKVNKGIVSALEQCDGSQTLLCKRIGLTKQRLSKIIHLNNETGYCPYSLREKLKNVFNFTNEDFMQCITFDCEYLTRNVILARLVKESN